MAFSWEQTTKNISPKQTTKTTQELPKISKQFSWETTTEPIPQQPTFFEKAGAGFSFGAKQSASIISQGINEYNKWFYNTFNKGKGAFGETYEPTSQLYDEKLKSFEKKAQEKLVERLGEQGANSYITQASAALAQGVGQLGAFAVHPVVGFTTIGAQVIGAGKQAYDKAYNTLLSQGKSEEEARKIAKINGIITGVVNSAEALPVARVFRLGKDLLKQPVKLATKETLKRVFKTAGIEAGTEGLQQLGEDITAYATYNKDETPLKNAIMATLVSIPTGILFGGAGEATVRLNRVNQAKEEIASYIEEAGGDKQTAKNSADFIVNQYALLGDENVFGEKLSQEEALTKIDEAIAKVQAGEDVAFQKKIQEAVVPLKEKVTPYKGEKDLTTKILKDLEGKTTVSKQYILDATNRGELKQVERDLIRNVLDTEKGKDVNVAEFAKKVKAELLPLKVDTHVGNKRILTDDPTGRSANGLAFRGGRYESISLPSEIRGNVKNYAENIYESPIKTSAGSVHFQDDAPNYFGHTRIEDMADNKTRRVIEVQSDLYQKGGLEREQSILKTDWGGKRYEVEREIKNLEEDLASPTLNSVARKSYEERLVRYKDDLAKLDPAVNALKLLSQYNDPTAHFRMIREEIKKAAQDGKTKLQFPTGETAMKIEGLGQNAQWIEKSGSNYSGLKPDNLAVGKEVYQAGQESSKWIITEVLGNGKFKAVPKNRLETEQGLGVNLTSKEMLDYATHHNKDFLDNYSETFDISGKVDTTNPIYKFYEKDIAKYLNKFGGKRVVDEQGVSWIEVPITKEMAEQPVEAFQKKGTPTKEIPFEEASKKLKADLKRLGVRGVDVVLANTIITPDNETAYGAFFDNSIALADFVKETTAEHELGHAIFRNLDNIPLFKDFDTNTLFEEARQKYGDKTNIELEENIMEDFEKYVTERQANKPVTFTGKIKEFFEKLYKQLKALFTHRTDLQAFYETMYEGKAITETELQSFNRLSAMVDKGVIDFNEAFAFQRKKDISQNEIEAEYTQLFEMPIQKTTEGKETKTLIEKNTLAFPDKKTLTKTEQRLIKERLKQQEKGFKAGIKAGKDIGKIEQQVKDFTQIEQIKRESELTKLRDAITRRSYINQVLNAVKTNIPPQERFKYMTRLASLGKKPSISEYQDILEDVFSRKEELDILAGESKEKARIRSTIAFLKKVNDLQPALVKDAKETLAIDTPVSKMNKEQLDKLLQEIRNRIDYLKRNNLVPQLPAKPTKFQTLAIAELALNERKTSIDFKKRASLYLEDIKNIPTNALTTVSAILKSVDPALSERLRTSEFNEKEYLNKQYLPVRETYSNLLSEVTKKDKTAGLALEIALWNSDIELAQEILTDLDMDTASLDDVRSLLDDIYNQFKAVGMDVGYLENMFPRSIRDVAKSEIAQKYNDEIQKMRDKVRAEKGRDLTEEEKAIIYTKYYRGFDAGNRIMLGAGRFDKTRTIPTIDTPDVVNYYEDSLTSLDRYVTQAIKLIEARKFFGKVNPELEIQDSDINNSIGYLAEKLEYEGKITSEENRKVQNALQAYFSTIEMNSVETFFINSAYVLGLGRATSAIPQLSETAMYLAMNDLSRAELNSLRKFNIKPEDLNMELLFDNKELNIKKISEYLTWHVRASDKISAMVGMNGMFRAIKNDASKLNSDGTYGTKELRNKIEWIFGSDKVDSVIADINETSFETAGKDLSLEFRRILYSEMGRYRVLSRMDKSPVFIRHPIWGVFKTYTIKMLEAMRFEGNQEIQNGIKEKNKIKIINGLQKKAFLIISLMIAGVGQRLIKDWLKGKELKEWSDYAIDAGLGMFGLGKYGFDMFNRYGFDGIFNDLVMPAPIAIPITIADSIRKDINKKASETAKTLNYVPIVGDILYNRLAN